MPGNDGNDTEIACMLGKSDMLFKAMGEPIKLTGKDTDTSMTSSSSNKEEHYFNGVLRRIWARNLKNIVFLSKNVV